MVYQHVHVLQLPALLLHTFTLHLNHKQQRLLFRLPECTWAAVGLKGEGGVQRGRVILKPISC